MILIHHLLAVALIIFSIKPVSLALPAPSKHTTDRTLLWWKETDWHCSGLKHQSKSFACFLAEALLLNRTAVLPTKFCTGHVHNFDHSTHAEDLSEIFDIQHLNATVGAVYDTDVHVTTISPQNTITVGALTSTPSALQKLGTTKLVIRQEFQSYWYTFCSPYPELIPFRNQALGLLRPPPRVSDIIPRIAARLHNDFDFLHVRRGDILKANYPQASLMDFATQPVNILNNTIMAQRIPPGRRLYIATNEQTPGFFNPLSTRYSVYQLKDFGDLLPPGGLSAYQSAHVDYAMEAFAKTRLETRDLMKGVAAAHSARQAASANTAGKAGLTGKAGKPSIKL